MNNTDYRVKVLAQDYGKFADSEQVLDFTTNFAEVTGLQANNDPTDSKISIKWDEPDQAEAY
jgi:hypothetical protein